MNDAMYKAIADDIREVNDKIEAAEDMIQFMRDAGENTSQAVGDLQSLKSQRDKYKNALESRGIEI